MRNVQRQSGLCFGLLLLSIMLDRYYVEIDRLYGAHVFRPWAAIGVQCPELGMLTVSDKVSDNRGGRSRTVADVGGVFGQVIAIYSPVGSADRVA